MSVRWGRARAVRRSLLAALALLAATTLATWPPAVHAGPSRGVSLRLAQLWNVVPSPGSWSPYTITVRNDGGQTFDGDVYLVPNPTRAVGTPTTALPEYYGAVTVPSGTEHTVRVYAVEASSGYHAELRDAGGSLVATANPDSASRADVAVGVLADLPQAYQRIDGVLKVYTRLDAAVSGFASVEAFPTSVLYLSGLDAVVLDRVDAASLSQAQVQAIRDFVGLGGALIVAGGATWRRSLLPLPADLVPLRPLDSGSASLRPLADLVGLNSDATTQVAVGTLAAWARVAVAAPDGTPLVVEGDVGSGRIVELAFDPFAPPFDTRLDLAGLAWGEAITRSVSGLPGSGSRTSILGFAGPVQPGVLGGAGPGGWVPFPGSVDQVFSSTPATPAPPFGLLMGLLIGYLLLVSVVSYVALKAAGRRGLLWVTVPALAVLCTGGAYLIGSVSRGSDFQLVQVQVQRMGPGGAVEAYSLDRVITPRRGDVQVAAGPESVMTTALISYSQPEPNQGVPAITMGAQPEVRFPNVPVWDVRGLQTLSVTHTHVGGTATMPVEARLYLAQGHIKGQIVNHTSRTVRDLMVASSSGSRATLVTALAPGATATVDAALSQSPTTPAIKVGVGTTGPVQAGRTGQLQALISLAATQAATSPGGLALVGTTDPVGELKVEGRPPASTALAVLAQPLRLQSADSLATAPPPARMVASYSGGQSSSIDVYELQLPPGLSSGVALQSAIVPNGAPQVTQTEEVYDWASGSWQPLPFPTMPGLAPATTLSPGEINQGVVRVRVAESSLRQVSLAVVDAR